MDTRYMRQVQVWQQDELNVVDLLSPSVGNTKQVVLLTYHDDG